MGALSLRRKKMKKQKKAKSSDRELEQRGDEAVTSSHSTNEKETTKSTSAQLDAAATGVDISARKAKKPHKNRKKKHASANDTVKSHEEGEEGEPDRNDQIFPQYDESSIKKGKKLKNVHKRKRKDDYSQKKENKPVHVEEDEADEVYQISSEDEDDSKGMKKWIRGYYENRPGIEVLQQRIDDLVTAYWEQEEQARRDREAKAAEDGWTVVVHKKGGKKTADPESGVVVGSVNQTAVVENMAKKKSKEVALDFYRFQRREAQRNEVMKLQSKFEEDKKRIKQMRAARKFRPY